MPHSSKVDFFVITKSGEIVKIGGKNNGLGIISGIYNEKPIEFNARDKFTSFQKTSDEIAFVTTSRIIASCLHKFAEDCKK